MKVLVSAAIPALNKLIDNYSFDQKFWVAVNTSNIWYLQDKN